MRLPRVFHFKAKVNNEKLDIENSIPSDSNFLWNIYYSEL